MGYNFIVSLQQQQKFLYMAKEVFNSIWGDLQVGTVTKVVDDKGSKPASKAPGEAPDDNVDDEDKGDDLGSEVDVGNKDDGNDDDSVDVDAKEGGTNPGNTEVGEEAYEFTDDDISKAFTMLEEEGILELGDEDEFEMTVPGLADAVGATVQNKLKKEIAAIPSVVQEFYTHVKQGKPIDDFVPSEAEVLWEDFNLETEENQEIALRELYKNQGMSQEDIDEEIEDVKETGKLEKKAIAGKSVLAISQAKTIEKRAEEANKREEKSKLKVKEEIDRIKGIIDNTDEMAGFKLNDERKKQFKDYLFKLDPRTTTTQMQKNMADEERKLRIAFLDFVDYTKADLTKEESTKLTKSRKKKLARFTDKGVKNSNSSATVKTANDSRKGKLIIPSIFGTQNIEIED